MDNNTDRMIDIIDPKQEVEVILRDGALWVNVDGRCRLRVKGIDKQLLKLDYNVKNWL